jgi:hypothetical protein
MPGIELSARQRQTVCERFTDRYFNNNWEEALERIRASAFCRGSGGNAWVANFDFFIRPNSVARILEGTYDDRINRRSGSRYVYGKGRGLRRDAL